jgi:hypothetical protein
MWIGQYVAIDINGITRSDNGKKKPMRIGEYVAADINDHELT